MATQKTDRSRKFMLTIQASQIQSGWSHARIREIIETKLKGVTYYAICDEIGRETGQPHTHLVIYSPNAIRISTVNNVFPNVHVDVLNGTVKQARTYLKKGGKFKDTEKADTSIKGTFEEHGEPPREKGQGHRSDIEQAMEMVKEGSTDLEIIEAIPSILPRLTDIQKYRQLIIEEKAREFRKMEVIYCYGKTGTGKTSGLYKLYDPATVCTITDYHGNGIFDGYDSIRVKVLALDEFRSSLPFSLLLALLDGNPLTINCRYHNRYAVHTTVWIISNIPLTAQYPNIQQEEPESWQALLRRITKVRHFYDNNQYHDYTVKEYLRAERYGQLAEWMEATPGECPFLPESPIEVTEQLKLNLTPDGITMLPLPSIPDKPIPNDTGLPFE